MAGRVAAFFDLDGTLIEGNVAGYLVRHLVTLGRISKRRLAALAGYNVLYKLNMLSPSSVHRAAAELVVGWDVEEANRVLAQVMDEFVHKRVYQGAVERIEWHRAQGHELVVVTAGSEHGARLLCERLAIPHVIGTQRRVRDGKIAEDFAVDDLCFGEAKVTRVRAFAEARGLDLGSSFAYSDSQSDLPLLMAVGHGHAVNPQWLLERSAREHGLPVLRFRAFADWPGSHGSSAA